MGRRRLTGLHSPNGLQIVQQLLVLFLLGNQAGGLGAQVAVLLLERFHPILQGFVGDGPLLFFVADQASGRPVEARDGSRSGPVNG